MSDDVKLTSAILAEKLELREAVCAAIVETRYGQSDPWEAADYIIGSLRPELLLTDAERQDA